MRTFSFAGREYEYFSHPYNNTNTNERAVEVPIVWAEVQACSGRVLELGNVLKHYFPDARHAVADKYEQAHGVVNVDAIDLLGSYDLIVSISTLEHVGQDEQPCDPPKSERAIANLVQCLVPGGRLLFTTPIGWNPYLDQLVRERRGLSSVRFLKRLDWENTWAETSDVEGVRYNEPFNLGNAVAVCEVRL